jgi:hypothetical protein
MFLNISGKKMKTLKIKIYFLNLRLILKNRHPNWYHGSATIYFMQKGCVSYNKSGIIALFSLRIQELFYVSEKLLILLRR